MPGTIKQIAEMAGVSRGTVDRVLNHRGKVDQDVARKVERIAQELGYLTKTQRKAAEKGEVIALAVRKRIGVVTQLAGASFMAEVMRGIQEASQKAALHGVEVIVRECAGVDGEAQVRQIRALEELGIDGLVIMPVDCETVRGCLNRLTQEKRVPVLTFNTDIVGVEKLAFVGMDNRRSGRAAAGLLAMLMGGRGRVLGIVGNFLNSAGMQRMEGFSAELRESFPDMELAGVQPSYDRTEEVEAILRQAAEAFPDLGGILLVSGGQAGIRKAGSLWNGRRPRVVLYDATPKNAALLREGCADFLIDQDGYTQGYAAVSRMLDKLRWDQDPEKPELYTKIDIRTKYTCG